MLSSEAVDEMLERPIWEGCDCPHCEDCKDEIKRLNGLLVTAVKVSEQHLDAKINLLNVIRKALNRLERHDVYHAAVYLRKVIADEFR